MGNIVLLDELTINKIAAGEVIERPASVVKEMVENSIDAGASNVTIEIKDGGISYIKITDNGKGIAKDDIEIAFERHATSKIRCAEDLNTVSSMGFRGEALASIAAIANVELVSKTITQDIGNKIVVEGGKILEKEEVGCQNGTSITVQNLFYNTPVRYKFLKKDYTETGYIEDVITRIALVNPQVAFKLISNGKTIIQTSGNGNLKDVIYSIYGKDIATGVTEVNYDYEDMKITGVIGKPEIARSNRSNQLFFVNKRYVKDKILISAIEQAYKGTIDAGKFAFVIINIEMPQNKVDVNVHPAKLEVRFQEESKVFQAIYHAIKDNIIKEFVSNEVSTRVDNIIIQSTNNDYARYETEKEMSEEIEEKKEEKVKTGIFGWRKNKNTVSENNIIEDLYNKKSIDEKSNEIENNIREYKEKDDMVLNIPDYDKEDDAVNTSDVLERLKKFRDKTNSYLNREEEKPLAFQSVKEEENKYSFDISNNEKSSAETNIFTKNSSSSEEKQLPDGSTYTYVGENKEKIEDLLRQLHPETYKPKENETVVETSVNETSEENKEFTNTENKFDNYTNNVANCQEQNEKEQENTISSELEDNKAIIQENNVIESKEEINQNSGISLEKPIWQMTNRYNISDTTKETTVNNIDTSNNTNATSQMKSTNNEFNKMYEKMFGRQIPQESRKEKLNAVDIIQENVTMFDSIPRYQRPTYKFIGTAFGSYIIAEIDKEMYIINEQTAKEKIIYEKLKANYYNHSNKDSQMLLLPDIIELSYKQIQIIRENSDILARAGFCIEQFGENTVKLMGVPTVCLDLDTKNLFREILDELNTVARTSRQEKEEKFLATIAEKIIIRAGVATSVEEINSIMDELMSLQSPFVYKFDKPVAIKMTKYDIERKFSRK